MFKLKIVGKNFVLKAGIYFRYSSWFYKIIKVQDKKIWMAWVGTNGSINTDPTPSTTIENFMYHINNNTYKIVSEDMVDSEALRKHKI